jgi:DNA-binding CsgD family transcriptional regulator
LGAGDRAPVSFSHRDALDRRLGLARGYSSPRGDPERANPNRARGSRCAGVRRAAGILHRAVPFDGAAIVACDPATALPIDKWAENSVTGSDGLRLMDIELHEADVNKVSDLALSGRRAASMSEATGGRLDRSLRYRELMRPRGFGDELRAACIGRSHMWGVIVMHRDLRRRNFSAREVALVSSLSGEFAEAFQRASLERALPSKDVEHRDGEPALLLLDEEGRTVMSNTAAAGWLEELGGDQAQLPLVVCAVAHRARAIASGDGGAAATARVRAASGRWALVRGSALTNGPDPRTAVTVEPARTAELARLIVDLYGLTERERLVTELVAQGLSTAAIAGRLRLSPFTVQDHLKAIFEKLGVSSRGELVARLFVDHPQAGLTHLDAAVT